MRDKVIEIGTFKIHEIARLDHAYDLINYGGSAGSKIQTDVAPTYIRFQHSEFFAVQWDYL